MQVREVVGGGHDANLSGRGRPQETEPPPGADELHGADASHAWLSVFVPGSGWLDLDPTNDQVPDGRYVVTAWGRDDGDVTPIKGVVFSGGGRHDLSVVVDVVRVAAP